MKKRDFWGNLWGNLKPILRRLEFLGLYSYLKVQSIIGRRSGTFDDNDNNKLHLSRIRILRLSAYLSSMILFFLTIATIIPIYTKSNQAEATTGTATASTLTFTSTRSTASVTLTVDSADGTFATSAANQTAAFSIATNNYTGYTLTLKSGGNVTTLDNSGTTISTISATTDYDTFTANTAAGKALNNKWGIIPNYYNSAVNTEDYYPAPTNESAITLRETSTANSSNGVDNADNYTIGLGLRADYTNPSGTYTNSTFIIQYVANPVDYNITYSADGIDGVSNLPGVQPGSASHTETSSTSGGTTTVTTGTTSVNLSTVVPTRTGYTFSGWCLGTLSNNGTTCTGTTYASGASFGIDKTANNNSITLKAKWTVNTYSLVITFAGTGVSSVKVCTVSGDCSGTNLKGTVSTSGGNVSGLAYGTAYYLYPAFTDGYEFDSWKKTDTATNSALSSTSSSNPTYTMGAGNGAVTITATERLIINLDEGIHGVIVRSGSPSGPTIDTITTRGASVNCPMSVECYLIPIYESGYTHSSTVASGGTVTSGTYGYYYYRMMAGVINVVTITGTALTSEATDDSLPAMQNLASTACTATPSAVRDLRDDSVYYIQRLVDGNCWMLENLRLDSGTLTSSDSDVASNYTLPASGTACFDNTADCDGSGDSTHTGYTVAAINSDYKTTTVTGYGAGRNYVGTYYNYCAASAGTICADSNSSDASFSICPSGWKMPIGGSNGHYQELFSALGDKIIYHYVLSTPFSGRLDAGRARGQNSLGYFWSSTWYNDRGFIFVVAHQWPTHMHSLYVNSSSTQPQSHFDRSVGRAVRCVLDTSYIQDLNGTSIATPFQNTSDIAMVSKQLSTISLMETLHAIWE